ncbi:SIFamide-related peptide [Bacillus rossius redtenbacheri]|uniref:SIFamide-related peptide n=1 Tax=Bacillus rossius redtenbacheri TaxID=93214 RepID=UPI002FDD5011
MQRAMLVRVVLAALLLLLAAPAATSAKKPPFNGSIFGKRSNYVAELRDYESNGRVLSAMCEIASEACASWFPQTDKR